MIKHYIEDICLVQCKIGIYFTEWAPKGIFHEWRSSLGFLKEDFLSFYCTHIVKSNDTPGAGPVLTPGL
jgi:hypothetical protein